MGLKFKVLKEKQITDTFLDGFAGEAAGRLMEHGANGWKAAVASEQERWDDQTRQQQIHMLRQLLADKGMVAAIYDGDRLAAYMAVAADKLGEKGKSRRLMALRVDASYRRQKVGTGLLEYAQYFLMELKGKRLLVEFTPYEEAVRFFEKGGFVLSDIPKKGQLTEEKSEQNAVPEHGQPVSDGTETDTVPKMGQVIPDASGQDAVSKVGQQSMPVVCMEQEGRRQAARYTTYTLIGGLFLGAVLGAAAGGQTAIGMLIGVAAGMALGVYLDTSSARK